MGRRSRGVRAWACVCKRVYMHVCTSSGGAPVSVGARGARTRMCVSVRPPVLRAFVRPCVRAREGASRVWNWNGPACGLQCVSHRSRSQGPCAGSAGRAGCGTAPGSQTLGSPGSLWPGCVLPCSAQPCMQRESSPPRGPQSLSLGAALPHSCCADSFTFPPLVTAGPRGPASLLLGG